jgi:iron complex transport system ATP-binding protein
MAELHVQNLSLSAGGKPLVSGASFTLAGGEFIALLGPNGAGKTSLLRGALGLFKLTSGTAALGSGGRNQPLETYKMAPAARARSIAYLPQIRPLAWPSLVKDIIALGRFSYGGPLARLAPDDNRAVQSAIARCGLEDLADRRADTLSGGELARVHIARALAAQASLLIADEPAAALDPRHQFRVMDLLRDYVNEGGGVMAVLHNISLAARYADRIILMDDGKIIADGAPKTILTQRRLAEIYGVSARIRGKDIALTGLIDHPSN